MFLRGWKQKKIKTLFVYVFVFVTTSQAFPQQGKKHLTYKQAYGGQDIRMMLMMMSRDQWLDDEHYLVSEQDQKTKKTNLYRVHAKTGERKVYVDYGLIGNTIPEGIQAMGHVDNTIDYSGLLYIYKNDLYHYSVKTKKLKRLTATPGQENNPKLSPDGRFVAYTRNHNLYSTDIPTGLEFQLTTDGSNTIYNGWASWVYMEEILGRGTRHRAFRWSPDSQNLAFLRFDDSPVPTFPLFREDGTHGELEIERYPKPGDPNPYVKLGIVSATGGQIVWADVEEKADHYVAWPIWMPDSSQLTFQWMNRGQDHIKIYGVDPKSGNKHEIYDEKQPAWVEFFEDLYFFKDGSGFLLRSNVDGWSHLYTYDLEGHPQRRLTEGAWAVTEISLVDKTKIGITGGSYGGYTTCMALTYGADYFTHGYARSSVTDWHLYDSVYTERYMDRPVENTEGYKFGFALTYAKNLKGNLFMAHGDMDDNVHMQNTIQLVSRLMDLGKQFEFMLYPDQRHGFRGSKREHSNRHYVDFWFKHFLNR